MLKYAFASLLLASLTFCEFKAEAATKVTFADKAGKSIALETAFELSSKGETIYRCQPVKATVSKSGTSITFKVVK